MMVEDYKQILTELTEVKTKIAIADFFISTFKQQDSDTLEKIALLKERVDLLDVKLYKELKDIDRAISQKIVDVEQTVINLNTKIEHIYKNSFLEFTKDMDLKKWLLVITTLFSLMAGNGVVDNVITDVVVPDTNKQVIKDKLEKLLVELEKVEKTEEKK